MVEALVTRLGNEIVGIASTTVDGVHLVGAARPDLVLYDLALGYNTDFDVVEAGMAVGAQVVLFSHDANEAVLSRYDPRPRVVAKPDLVALEDVLSRLVLDEARGGVVEQERRRRPTRQPAGLAPSGVADAQAFYEAINDARPGDAMVSFEVQFDAPLVGEELAAVLRSTDRLLAFSAGVRVFLVDGGEEGIDAFLQRVREAGVVPAGTTVTAVVVVDGESPIDAFERLKHGGQQRTV